MNGYLASARPSTYDDVLDRALGDMPLLMRQAAAQWKRMSPSEKRFTERWVKQRIAALPETKRRMVKQIVERELRQGWTPGQLSGHGGLGNAGAAGVIASIAALATTGFQVYAGLEQQKAQKEAQAAQLQLQREAAAREAALFEQQMEERRRQQQIQEQQWQMQQAAIQKQLESQNQDANQAADSAGVQKPGMGTGTKVALAAGAAAGAMLLMKG